MLKTLDQVKREKVDFLAPLKDPNSVGNQKEFAIKLCAEAQAVGLNLRDYLTWKIDARASANDNGAHLAELNGYEATLSYLNLPVREDIEQGVMLQAASNTFQTYPGTRILFPQVIDDVARWKYRQTNFEQIGNLVGSSRSIQGNEIHYMLVNADGSKFKRMRAIAEGGRIPIYTIQGSEQSVKIHKFGMGFELTYEFERRASIDLLTPYVARSEREVEMSKVWEATRILINGDGAFGAATEIAQSSYDTAVGTASTDGKISYQHLLAWLVARAKAGYPIDTVVGNYDAYLQWLMMFAVPTSSNGETQAESLARSGFRVAGVPLIDGVVQFALSSAAPANKLIGYSKADTLEQLDETGSQISENQKAIETQKTTYVKTENSGFRLVFEDTRSVYDFGN